MLNDYCFTTDIVFEPLAFATTILYIPGTQFEVLSVVLPAAFGATTVFMILRPVMSKTLTVDVAKVSFSCRCSSFITGLGNAEMVAFAATDDTEVVGGV